MAASSEDSTATLVQQVQCGRNYIHIYIYMGSASRNKAGETA